MLCPCMPGALLRCCHQIFKGRPACCSARSALQAPALPTTVRQRALQRLQAPGRSISSHPASRRGRSQRRCAPSSLAQDWRRAAAASKRASGGLQALHCRLGWLASHIAVFACRLDRLLAACSCLMPRSSSPLR